MGGGKDSGDTSSEIRYAPYLERLHKQLLTGDDGWPYHLKAAMTVAWDSSPYTDREDILIEDGLLGSGYTIDQFPSLFDMFGKFMAGLDIETLWTQSYNQVMGGPEIDDLIETFNQSTLDNMHQKSLPMLHAGMRDIGAVNSSAFIMGRALLESERNKEVTKFTSQIKHQGLQLTQERWARHLDWNRSVVSTYADIMQLFYVGAMDLDKLNYKYKESDILWNLRLFEYARALMGALGGGSATAGIEGPSQLSSALGGALSGAAAGAMVGSAVPVVGTAVGAAVGGAIGIASAFF